MRKWLLSESGKYGFKYLSCSVYSKGVEYFLEYKASTGKIHQLFLWIGKQNEGSEKEYILIEKRYYVKSSITKEKIEDFISRFVDEFKQKKALRSLLSEDLEVRVKQVH